MAVFMLETDALTSAASSISSLASQISGISSSINGYDTSCEDGFDFAGAKSILAANAEACATKITNTSSILENVVSAHTELQSSMKFDGSGNTSSAASSSSDSSSSASSSSTSSSGYYDGNYSGSASSGGGYSGGGYSGGGYSGGGSSSGGYYSDAIATGISGTLTSSDESASDDNDEEKEKNKTASDESKKSDEKSDEKENQKTEDKEDSNNKKKKNSSEKIITTKLNDVNYAYINSDKLTNKSKDLFNDASFKYDSNTGYATVDGKYVIACDSSVGDVGDIIKFTQKDGKVVECVVGTNTVTEASKSTVNFIVDKDSWSSKTPMSVTENLINNTSSVSNTGQYTMKPSGTITNTTNSQTTATTSANTNASTNSQTTATASTSASTNSQTTATNNTTTNGSSTESKEV